MDDLGQNIKSPLMQNATPQMQYHSYNSSAAPTAPSAAPTLPLHLLQSLPLPSTATLPAIITPIGAIPTPPTMTQPIVLGPASGQVISEMMYPPNQSSGQAMELEDLRQEVPHQQEEGSITIAQDAYASLLQLSMHQKPKHNI